MMKDKASGQQERREELRKKRKKEAWKITILPMTVLFLAPYNYHHVFKDRAEIL